MKGREQNEKSENQVTLKEFWGGLKSMKGRFLPIVRGIREMRKIKQETLISLGTFIEANALEYADIFALRFESENYTYREFNELCNRYSNYFLSIGAEKGDVAVVLLENRPELLFCIGGLAKIGVIASLINPNLRGPVLEHCVSIVSARFFIIGESLTEAFDEIRPELNLNPTAKLFISVDQGETKIPDNYIDLKTQLDQFPVTNPKTTAQIQAQDPLCYIFTSGTTGKPKAAVINNRRWLAAKYGFGGIMALTPEDTIYIPLPFSHSTALLVAWGPAIHGGATTVMRRKFSVSQFWEDVAKYNATAFAYIGELCRYLLNQPPKPTDADNTIEKIIGNGLRPDIWKTFKERFGIKNIYEFYASSEGNVAFTNLLNLDRTIGLGMGKQAIVKYDIEEDETVKNKKGYLQKVTKGEAGLLLGEITDDAPFTGYTSTEATETKIIRNAFKKNDAWFNTGDLVKSIGFGHYQFIDRVGDTFRWKSENVSTTEVEEVINTLDQVKESTVYGVKIPGTEGRGGMVSLIAKTDLENFDFKNFAASLKRALPSYAIPIFIRFQEEFEITPTMKRIKSQLKQGGFDPNQVKDPLYVMLSGEPEYKHLTDEIFKGIEAGYYRF